MVIGYAMCGSFCTFERSLRILEKLSAEHEVVPIMSENAYSTDTRFGRASMIRERVKAAGGEIIHTIEGAEPFGATRKLDLLIISPCTGNTLSKLANGITDTTVTMAAKAQLRSDRPILISLASNDAMSANLSNIGKLLCRKGIYFVPMVQDDPESKPHSLVAEFEMTIEAIRAAMEGRQLRPVFL